MSHEATSWAIKQRGLKPATKIVLFYLADRHNPDFGCFPSHKTLAVDAEMSERSVRDHLDILEQRGLISRTNGHIGGQFKSNRYMLAFEKNFQRQDLPTAKSANGENSSVPTAKSAADHRQDLPTNLVSEPCKVTRNTEDAGDKPCDILGSVASAQAAKSFISFRTKIRKPLTETGARRLAAALSLIATQGGDPDDALGMAEERGWQSIKPEWYFKEINHAQPSRQSFSRQHPGAGQQLSGLAGAAMRSFSTR